MSRTIHRGLVLLVSCLSLGPWAQAGDIVFPGKTWERRAPEAVGLDGGRLEAFGKALGGRGCVVKDGFLVHAWGDPTERGDLYSSVKPLLSTLLFFAVEEGRIASVDVKVKDFGWALRPKDQSMTFRHLADMTSGYARPEPPGAAWAYNDYAIMLYQLTLFDRVYKQDALAVLTDPKRLGPLQFEDQPEFTSRRRLRASTRDFARIAWFWLNRGRWGDVQLLPKRYFDEFMKPDVAIEVPRTRLTEGPEDDYLRIGSFGGGSDHFANDLSGIYGFNWWYNSTGARHRDTVAWPALPRDAVLSLGARGNHSVLVPSLKLTVTTALGDWGGNEPGRPDSKMNQRMGLLMAAVKH